MLLLLVQTPIVGQECLNAGFESGLTNGYSTFIGSIDTFGNVVVDELKFDPERFAVMHINV